MKRSRINQLADITEGHILNGLLPGPYIGNGGLVFEAPGARAHTNDGPGGIDYHVHDGYEAFIILQGKGAIEVDKIFHPLSAGDVIVIEPGEDHHVNSSQEDPIVIIWLQPGTERNAAQQQ